MSRSLCALAVLVSAAGSAHAATILTFADPAAGPSTPLFTLAGGTLTGGWSDANPGLLLETPGLAAPNFANAWFDFSPVTVTPTGTPPFFTLSAGTINFYADGTNTPLVTITFSGGLLTDALGFGSSTFAFYDVQFTGAIIAPGNPVNEAFSFSFANQVGSGTNYTATASFTSSADNIPAPASFALLGLGMLVISRRRR
jgi:uncharacterized protein (TIGR03382 family)